MALKEQVRILEHKLEPDCPTSVRSPSIFCVLSFTKAVCYFGTCDKCQSVGGFFPRHKCTDCKNHVEGNRRRCSRHLKINRDAKRAMKIKNAAVQSQGNKNMSHVVSSVRSSPTLYYTSSSISRASSSTSSSKVKSVSDLPTPEATFNKLVVVNASAASSINTAESSSTLSGALPDSWYFLQATSRLSSPGNVRVNVDFIGNFLSGEHVCSFARRDASVWVVENPQAPCGRFNLCVSARDVTLNHSEAVVFTLDRIEKMRFLLCITSQDFVDPTIACKPDDDNKRGDGDEDDSDENEKSSPKKPKLNLSSTSDTSHSGASKRGDSSNESGGKIGTDRTSGKKRASMSIESHTGQICSHEIDNSLNVTEHSPRPDSSDNDSVNKESSISIQPIEFSNAAQNVIRDNSGGLDMDDSHDFIKMRTSQQELIGEHSIIQEQKTEVTPTPSDVPLSQNVSKPDVDCSVENVTR